MRDRIGWKKRPQETFPVVLLRSPLHLWDFSPSLQVLKVEVGFKLGEGGAWTRLPRRIFHQSRSTPKHVGTLRDISGRHRDRP